MFSRVLVFFVFFQGLLSFLSAPLIGALSDVWGRKSFLLLTVFFTCAPIPLMKISPWWAQISWSLYKIISFFFFFFSSTLKCFVHFYSVFLTGLKQTISIMVFLDFLFKVVFCSHLHVWCFCRHLLCDLCLRGRHHARAWEEHSVWFGKETVLKFVFC